METINKNIEITINNETINLTPEQVAKVVELYPTFDPNFKELKPEQVVKLNDKDFEDYVSKLETFTLASVLIKKLTKQRSKDLHLNKENTLLLYIYNGGLNGVGVEQMFEKGKHFRDAKEKLSPISDGIIYARWNVLNKPYAQRGLMEIKEPEKGQPVNCTIFAKTFDSRPDSKFALKRKCGHENKLYLQRGHENLKQYLLDNGAKEEMFTYDWNKFETIKTK